jgi:hypothetical protein
MVHKNRINRRSSLKVMGSIIGATTALGTVPSISAAPIKNKSIRIRKSNNKMIKEIETCVWQTPLIDTHEHLLEEHERLSANPQLVRCDDWTMVMSMYLDSDLFTAGMPKETWDQFFSTKVDPIDKWSLLEPYWLAIKNTGYGQAVSITIKELYGVEELSKKTIKKVQQKYEETRRHGFYKRILRDLANIESCQVNCLNRPFSETTMPTLLMQDLSIWGMHAGPNFKQFGEPTGITIHSLSDWHRVISWWFTKYGKYAIAVKSQHAYNRNIDYEKIPADKAAPIFKKKIEEQTLTSKEQKALEDHLFWFAVKKATELNLPVKLHTGYYAGHGYMPLSRLLQNPGSATDLCRMAPDTNFIFMHICYPYYEELIAIAKHYPNAYVDMCWAWIINPIAAKDFLKKYLVTAPANKILTFGGDYIQVETVLGHATIARHGISLALSELVEEGWLKLDAALELINPIMNGNSRRIFNVKEKTALLKKVQWN